MSAGDQPADASGLERVQTLEEGAAAGCVFCKIMLGKLPCKRVPADPPDGPGGDAWIINDLHPAAPVHWLAMPALHLPRVSSASDEQAYMLGRLFLALASAARRQGLSDYRLIVNNGVGAGQTVPHLHVHLLAGTTMGERLV